MARTVFPAVALILPCDEAIFELVRDRWVIVNPWTTTVELAEGAGFPFRADEIWVYTQLTGGLGAMNLALEVLQLREDGTRRQIGISGAVRRLSFGASNQLVPLATAFRLKRVPFRSEGVYEFRMIASDETGSWMALNGPTAQVRLLDRGGTL